MHSLKMANRFVWQLAGNNAGLGVWRAELPTHPQWWTGLKRIVEMVVGEAYQ
jgi:hypothetical protein